MTTDPVCASCGETNPGGATFCTNCTAYLGWDEPRPSRPAAAPAVPPEETTAEPAPQSSTVATVARPRGFLWDDPVTHRRLAASGAPRPAPDVLRALPGRGCPQCGTANEGERRFCAKCGNRIRRSAAAGEPVADAPAQRLSWWRRWWRTTDLVTPTARGPFRRALPRSYRLRRWTIGLLVAALLAGAGVALVHNPVTWVKARWADLTGSVTAVSDVQAQVEPSSAALAQYGAKQAVDRRGDTAWGLAWNAKTRGADDCVGPNEAPPKGTAVLRLLLPQPVTVRKVVIYAGLSADDPRRLHQWRPRTVDLGFADGSCRRITLTPDADAQAVTVTPTTTDELTLSVVDAYPAPTDAPDNTLAISEVEVWQRSS